jgi:hypothetical protein
LPVPGLSILSGACGAVPWDQGAKAACWGRISVRWAPSPALRLFFMDQSAPQIQIATHEQDE